jgi:hypothetical protein
MTAETDSCLHLSGIKSRLGRCRFARHPQCPDEQMTSEWGWKLRHFWEAGRAAITLSGRGVTQEQSCCCGFPWLRAALSGENGRGQTTAPSEEGRWLHSTHTRDICSALEAASERRSGRVERMVLAQPTRAGSTVVAKRRRRANGRPQRSTCWAETQLGQVGAGGERGVHAALQHCSMSERSQGQGRSLRRLLEKYSLGLHGGLVGPCSRLHPVRRCVGLPC